MYKKYEKYYNVISSKKKKIILFCILEGKKTACKNLACNGRARTGENRRFETWARRGGGRIFQLERNPKFRLLAAGE